VTSAVCDILRASTRAEAGGLATWATI
jgi:hypothetical protein